MMDNKPKKITTLEMEIALMRYFGVTKYLIINNTYETMFECDILAITKAGYATGVEIKVSKSDLKNDLKKKHIKNLGSKVPYFNKDAKEHYFGQFKKFYYAVPIELQDEALKQIPSFCGLFIAYETKYYGIQIKEIRKPSILYKYKWSMEKMMRVAWLGTMRIQGLKESLLSYKKEIKNLKSYDSQ